MTKINPFVLPTVQYRRDINVFKHYVLDAAFYLSKRTSRSVDQCMRFVQKAVQPGGQFEFKDPAIVYLQRGDNGDREKLDGKLSVFLGEAIQNHELIAPTLTTYLHPSVKKSILVDFIDGNVKQRSKAKTAMFEAKTSGNKPLEIIKKTEQTNKKLSNNALSGGHVSPSTPLFNRTAHSTLTSNCRSTSGYGNANNEKFLCGNRHYWSIDIIINNIVSICTHSDLPKIQSTLYKYGIVMPSVEETLLCIAYSARLYRVDLDAKGMADIAQLVNSLSEVERAAFVYTGDLYHLMKFNDAAVRVMIDRLSMCVLAGHSDPASVINKATDDERSLGVQICAKHLKVPGENMNALKAIKHPKAHVLASTLVNIDETLAHYSELIQALWVTPNVPASMAYFPESIRRAAITSDTDSTIFTVQEWVIWFSGSLDFSGRGNAVAATMIFLASQTITHVLARMSANFGIERDRLHQIAMKNEFKFDVFVPTQVAKHYFALISCQEGVLNDEYEVEIKGVHLKSSNAPKAIMKKAKEMIVFIMNQVEADRPISINALLKEIADIERAVVRSIEHGSFEYFKKGQIKSPESYTKEKEESPYAQYLMWQHIFAPKYGDSVMPPYMSVKVSTGLDSPAKTREWIEQMEDRELAERVLSWLRLSGRKHLGTTMLLPEQCISSRGIPTEVLETIGERKIVLETTKVFYIIMETLGVYMLNGKTTRLISDYH